MIYTVNSKEAVANAVRSIINSAKKSDGPRALFRTGKAEISDTPMGSKAFDKQYKDFPKNLIGVYDKSCVPGWLEADIEHYAAVYS